MGAVNHFVPSAEAAFIAGITQQQMNRMADESLVADWLLAREDGSRRFARITAAWAKFFFDTDTLLIASARKSILSELTARVASSKSSDDLICLHGLAQDMDWKFQDPKSGLLLDFTGIVTVAISRAKAVDEADELITKVDGIMGGKPCFKGTRLPIDMVLASLEKGLSEDRIADEYSISKEQINAARVYAQVHPQRGRPVRLGVAKPAVQ
jgi:uncharacterized protein (DUF433 family)